MSRPALLVTGARGLVGQALAARRETVGLSRRDPGDGGPWWEPLEGRVHAELPSLGAVVHLAGEPVANGRWDAEKRRRIRDSRVTGTRTLVDWLLDRSQRPSVLVSASAVGFYGDRGEELLPESAGAGTGFFPEVVAAWEAEALRARQGGIRVVCLRIGIVLDPEGGALARMLPAFRLGGGGPMGSGRQWFPWVHRDDLLGLLEWALTDEAVSGPVNAVAPGIVRQRDFARTLGRQLRRPALLPAPAFAMKLAFPGLAEEGLLASARVVPQAALDGGYAFRFPELGPALGDLLG